MTATPSYLVLWSIGGVQELQSSARRTQDAWMRSYMVSWLVSRAIVRLQQKLGDTVTFVTPDIADLPLLRMASGSGDFALEDVLIPNVPNTVLMHYTSSEDDPRRVLSVLSESVRDEFARLAAEVRLSLMRLGQAVTKADESVWEDQVVSMTDRLGLHGCYVPILDDHSGSEWQDYRAIAGSVTTPYAVAVHSLGRLLAMDKQARRFTGRGAGGNGLWCSCRLRSAVPVDWAALTSLEARYVRETDADNFDRTAWNDRETIRCKWKVKAAGRVNATESLCAVCVTLRFAWELYFLPRLRALPGVRSARETDAEWHLLFPSTASMAAAPFVHALVAAAGRETGEGSASRPLRRALGSFLESLAAVAAAMGQQRDEVFWASSLTAADRHLLASIGDAELRDLVRQLLWLDGDALYPESLEDPYFTAEREVRADRRGAVHQELAKARSALAALHREARALGVPALSPYLAILVFDGDRMGEWLRLPDGYRSEVTEALVPEGEVTMEYQQRLASLLRRFSLEAVPDAVVGEVGAGSGTEAEQSPPDEASPLGHLVFAGGEDVLALAPASRAVGIAHSLRSAYREVVGEELEGDYAQRGMTASAAILIMHRGDDLGACLREAYALLKGTAKEALGRDACAIRVRKGSGTTVQMGGSWKEMHTFGAVLDAFRDGVSSRLIGAVEEAVQRSGQNLDNQVRGNDLESLGYPREWILQGDARAALTAALGRALQRREIAREDDDHLNASAPRDKWSAALNELVTQLLSRGVPARDIAEHLTDALSVAEFINRHELVRS